MIIERGGIWKTFGITGFAFRSPPSPKLKDVNFARPKAEDTVLRTNRGKCTTVFGPMNPQWGRAGTQGKGIELGNKEKKEQCGHSLSYLHSLPFGDGVVTTTFGGDHTLPICPSGRIRRWVKGKSGGFCQEISQDRCRQPYILATIYYKARNEATLGPT